MKDKVFIDTNLWIYLFSNDAKSLTVENIIKSNFNNIIISTQVLNEFFNVIVQKRKIKTIEETKVIIESLINNFFVSIIDYHTITTAIDVSKTYQFNYFDSLMISSALIEDCSMILTEDMKHQQIIDKKLKIINPFK
jgi:predicted nucleic acid-binding protein